MRGNFTKTNREIVFNETTRLNQFLASTQSRIFIVDCEDEQRQIPVGRYTKYGAPAYNAARINQPSGRTTNGKICMALIRSTLDETDWKDVLGGVAF